MTAANVLVMVHGMTTNPDACSPFGDYEQFWERLCASNRQLRGKMVKQIGIHWGHEIPTLSGSDKSIAKNWGYDQSTHGGVQKDEELTYAQKVLGNRVNYDAVRTDPDPNNILLPGLFGIGTEIGLPVIRSKLLMPIRENIILRGFGDAVYYCSTDGERAVRKTAYKQILTQITQIKSHDTIRLHIVGHSLGVTVAHDLLYGLFAKDHKPDFVLENQGDPDSEKLFSEWRGKAQSGKLILGSFISCASQIPLFTMRKQTMVDILYNDGLFHAEDIGIVGSDIRWINFYDIDDMLGFPTRRLYTPNVAIREIQVDCGDTPEGAHMGYWENETVIRETAQLLYQNCG